MEDIKLNCNIPHNHTHTGFYSNIKSEHQDGHNYVQNLLQLQGVVLRLKRIVGDHATSRMFWEAEEGGLALIPGHSHFQVFTVQGDDKLEWKQPRFAQTLFIFPQPCATPPSHLLDEFEASVVL